MRAEEFEIARRRMLAEISARAVQLRETTGRAAFDERVMAAMGRVPRHEFVPIEYQPFAHTNIPLPIGFDKTISQPYIVALMTDLLDIGPDDAVLEIGTGLGYQAAILAQLAPKVYSIEIIEELGRQAKQRLRLSRLVRALPVRQGDRDSGARFDSSAADPAIKTRREVGHSGRSA
jgi:protein-L-isoaspartate(D-aspartate) O-methyltransferase